jgi:hypothetical protein
MHANLPSVTTHRSRARPRPEEFAGGHAVDTGSAQVIADADGRGGWSVWVNGVLSSHVDIEDPTRLEFEYMQWIGQVLDVAAPGPAPISVVHVGGAGCTMALYVAATRPGSKQTVFEVDAALATLARQAFGLRAVRGLSIKSRDGRHGLSSLPPASADVVIRDAFAGASVPEHLTTAEFHREAARVLRPTGVYVANVADTRQVHESRIEAVGALQTFAHVGMIAEPAQLRGRRFGNVLVLASAAPLPTEALIRALAGGMVRARLVPHARVLELVAGVRPRHDADLDAR